MYSIKYMYTTIKWPVGSGLGVRVFLNRPVCFFSCVFSLVVSSVVSTAHLRDAKARNCGTQFDCLERLISIVTYYLWSGTCNSAHSLTHSLKKKCITSLSRTSKSSLGWRLVDNWNSWSEVSDCSVSSSTTPLTALMSASDSQSATRPPSSSICCALTRPGSLLNRPDTSSQNFCWFPADNVGPTIS